MDMCPTLIRCTVIMFGKEFSLYFAIDRFQNDIIHGNQNSTKYYRYNDYINV